MKYATTTPANVRRAVAIYIVWRRFVGAAAALLAGGAAAAAAAVAFMAGDRYVQGPQLIRDAGPWVAGLALGAGVAAAIAALLRRHSPFRVAVRLDQAFPQHQDRWSSSLDLAEQVAGRAQCGQSGQSQPPFCGYRVFAGGQCRIDRVAAASYGWRRWGLLSRHCWWGLSVSARRSICRCSGSGFSIRGRTCRATARHGSSSQK